MPLIRLDLESAQLLLLLLLLWLLLLLRVGVLLKRSCHRKQTIRTLDGCHDFLPDDITFSLLDLGALKGCRPEGAARLRSSLPHSASSDVGRPSQIQLLSLISWGVPSSPINQSKHSIQFYIPKFASASASTSTSTSASAYHCRRNGPSSSGTSSTADRASTERQAAAPEAAGAAGSVPPLSSGGGRRRRRRWGPWRERWRQDRPCWVAPCGRGWRRWCTWRQIRIWRRRRRPGARTCRSPAASYANWSANGTSTSAWIVDKINNHPDWSAFVAFINIL